MHSNRHLYLHIGLPKTASTYLQKEVFAGLNGLRYLEKPVSDVIAESNRSHYGYGLLDYLTKKSALLWREYGDEVFSAMLGDRAEVAASDRHVLISDEGIGARASTPMFLRCHLEEFAAKAADWGFARTQVLCVFRRQDQWLGSHYAQISDRMPGASQKEFESYVDAFLDRGRQYYVRGTRLDYKGLRDQLVRALGPENVHMLPYEMLGTDPAGFRARIESILGTESEVAGRGDAGPAERPVRHNVRSQAPDNWALRRRTRRLRVLPASVAGRLGTPSGITLRLPRLRGRSIVMTQQLRVRILNVYRAGNRILAEDLDLDLSDYGYW